MEGGEEQSRGSGQKILSPSAMFRHVLEKRRGSKFVSQRFPTGAVAENLLLGTVGLDREGDGAVLDDLSVKKFQRGPWLKPDFGQHRLGLLLEVTIHAAF